MAQDFKMILQEIGQLIADVFGLGEKKVSYVREILFAIVLLCSLGIGFVGYRWYIQHRERTAQKTFSDYLQEYQLAMNAQNPAEWQRLESVLSYGFSQNANSYIAPYFLALQAEAQLKQGNKDQAVATLSRVVDTIKNPAMKQMFGIKRALILLDNADETIRNQGLHDLIDLSRQSSAFTDMALFYIGRYYWIQNNTADAKATWQELADMKWLDKSSSSPWVYEAKTMLKQIG